MTIRFYNYAGKPILIMGEDGVLTEIPMTKHRLYYVFEENVIRDSYGVLDKIPVKLYYLQRLPDMKKDQYILMPEMVYNLMTEHRDDIICIKEPFYDIDGKLIDDTALCYLDKHRLIDILFNNK